MNQLSPMLNHCENLKNDSDSLVREIKRFENSLDINRVQYEQLKRKALIYFYNSEPVQSAGNEYGFSGQIIQSAV